MTYKHVPPQAQKSVVVDPEDGAVDGEEPVWDGWFDPDDGWLARALYKAFYPAVPPPPAVEEDELLAEL